MGNITIKTFDGETYYLDNSYLHIAKPNELILGTPSKEKVIFDGDYTIYYDFYGKKQWLSVWEANHMIKKRQLCMPC